MTRPLGRTSYTYRASQEQPDNDVLLHALIGIRHARVQLWVSIVAIRGAVDMEV
jgi:hypothetical protein